MFINKDDKPEFSSCVHYLGIETMAKRVPAAMDHKPKLESLGYLSFLK